MILVTGGAGYIGSHVNLVLNEAGLETIVLDDLSLGHREMVVGRSLLQGDFGDTALLDIIFTENKIDAVVHLAAFTDVDDSICRPSDYYKNNVVKTLALLDAMIRHSVKQIIFSSTSAVYEEKDGQSDYVETDTQLPLCPYGRSKLFIERTLSDYQIAYGLNYVAFRYFNAAGADPSCRIGEWHEPEPHLIPVVLDVALGRRKQIHVFGTDYPTRDGTCVRDFIHVFDIAGAHLKAIEHLQEGRECGVFNLGYGTGFSVAEIIDACRKITGRNITAITSNRRPGDAASSIANCSKARDILGWHPQYNNIDNVIASAWNWHKHLHGKLKPNG